jgi:hypothetical protein
VAVLIKGISMSITMSQKSAREGLGNPELFQGGVYVTKNGLAELFVQTAEEREAELRERERERQSNALLKLVMAAKRDKKWSWNVPRRCYAEVT